MQHHSRAHPARQTAVHWGGRTRARNYEREGRRLTGGARRCQHTVGDALGSGEMLFDSDAVNNFSKTYLHQEEPKTAEHLKFTHICRSNDNDDIVDIHHVLRG